jgi:DMSO/TMAO reductase YedYZ molybdopterin-dependent catalytic subunit
MPGLLAAATVVVVQRLLHAAYHEAPFAPYAMAEWMIRKSPGPLATWAIDNLGHNAQSLLGWSFIAGTLVLGFAIGRRPAWLLAGVAFALTVLASYLDPISNDTGGTIASAGIAAVTAYVAVAAFSAPPAPATEHDPSRRRLLAKAGLGAVVVGVAGTAVFREGSRAAPDGPVRADQPAVIPPDATFSEVPELSPRVTSRADHYTVDINLEDPRIGQSSWRLVVDGAVESPQSWSLADLQAMHSEERLFNLSCISNKVGGHLISNSRWTGVSLDTLLDAARPLPEAVTLMAVCYDGFTDGIVLGDIRGKGAIVAFGMNGQLLPRSHGFPARLIFPNHYGMRNVKWLTRLELLTEDKEGYWAERGWDRDAVVRTQSRIDVPGNGDRVDPPFVCAGIAWAGHRRIERVEVSADGGETWQDAELEVELSTDSWRRWQVLLDTPPGKQRVVARAYDGTGTPQDARERNPHPSGASGYHRIEVNVEET